jgi:uncharacterized membrane protein YagU involved in acid resistance
MKHQKRQVILWANVLTHFVFTIAIAVMIIVLHRFTGLPFWAAATLVVVYLLATFLWGALVGQPKL